MKTKKAYGLWNHKTKTLDTWSVHGSPATVREAAVYELSSLKKDWIELRKEGYRVIPVTITYEEPKK